MSRPFRSARRMFFSKAYRPHRLAVAASAVAVSVVTYSSLKNRPIQNDSLPPRSFKSEYVSEKLEGSVPNSGRDSLNTLVWGSNNSQKLLPKIEGPASQVLRSPTPAKWLHNVALRDIAFHKEYAAAIDARGNVYQWGHGAEEPSCILKGKKNIREIRLTNSKIYALSTSGNIFALSADRASHLNPATSTPWPTGWLWGGKNFGNFQEITPNTPLDRGEKFVSISAGQDHLLGLTSNGRAFAHPLNRNANAYGQLGFRKFDAPDPSVQTKARIPVELVPKSVIDPFSRASPFKRSNLTPNPEQATIHIDLPFCPNVFEIPSLKGINLSKVVAGGRSSFALTSTGRVLAWGANEYGQLGLGDSVTLDTITVPTEVILWRMASSGTQTRCLDVFAGGDLTCFIVERARQVTAQRSTSIEVLLSGNGQNGSLGNNLYTNVQGSPVRARNISNLSEYDDVTNSLKPIAPDSVSVSPTGHVLLALKSAVGCDLLAWGRNYDSELGNGKRSGLPSPTTLSAPDGGRLIMRRKKAKEVLDLEGKVWKRGVEVEQKAVAGHNCSAVFWKSHK
ncbi:hypothetical protein D9757_002046 [Collybiopsis confluens]|uniref:Uncharacterized protein n=1 Tax=Collybiopsis confluens TaxID=2823264 RepID=A0A8H5HXU7_9AGAR|nr:hypothetical protein D9757_002046 [Collybiopsis confluens]